MKTDRNGRFIFKILKIKKNDNELKIYSRKNKKENQISELTFLNLGSNKLTTEYQRLHEGIK